MVWGNRLVVDCDLGRIPRIVLALWSPRGRVARGNVGIHDGTYPVAAGGRSIREGFRSRPAGLAATDGRLTARPRTPARRRDQRSGLLAQYVDGFTPALQQRGGNQRGSGQDGRPRYRSAFMSRLLDMIFGTPPPHQDKDDVKAIIEQKTRELDQRSSENRRMLTEIQVAAMQRGNDVPLR